jgi:predicted HicB family RNase H-like nuclease
MPPKEDDTKDTETSRTIIVRLAVETHKTLRIRVASDDTSIQKWVESLIEKELGIKE